MAQLVTAIRQLRDRDGGQDLIEYAMLVALIVIVAMVGVSALGTTISNVFWTQIGAAI
jgi:Flp pilus assembly pilin Flp